MTKTILILAIIVLAVGIQSAYACAPEDIQHWNKITFFSTTDNLVHDTEPDILTTNLYYEVLVQADTEVVSFVPKLVSDKLNEIGYVNSQSGLAVTPEDIGFLTIAYSAFCNDFDINQVIGGLLIQPDSATLVLAYGIANAIWLVPSVAGIGIAIYLTKNRWQKH